MPRWIIVVAVAPPGAALAVIGLFHPAGYALLAATTHLVHRSVRID